MRNLPEISIWSYRDLKELPSEETDLYEYKSSRTKIDRLKNKISIAASSFWNSGGGLFIAGMDNEGKVDGGFPKKIGKQSLRDWTDQAIRLTEPLGLYEIALIEMEKNEENVVLVVKFLESPAVPHMAYDKKYYIRAGAHSSGATHFQVEVLRTFRQISKPQLRGLMKYHPTKPEVEELVIVAINDSVALDIKLNFEPFPQLFKNNQNDFPLLIALIDKNNPFRMEISWSQNRTKMFGNEPVKLILEYKDVLGYVCRTDQMISPQKSMNPVTIGTDVYEKLVKAIDKLADKIK